MSHERPREPVISVHNLVKRFDGRAVLDGVSLDIYPGEVMVIMGGSGSGKSTLLRHMIRSMVPDEGDISLFGKNICGLPEDDMNAVRRQFGVLFQSGALFNSMTVAENVALPLREHTNLAPEVIDIQVKIKLELVNLRDAADRYPSEISGGMKKRAGLARALSLDPKIMFYDEPSAGLDPITSAEIDKLMLDLTKKLGITSVVVTHEMDSAFAIADRMAMLRFGKMLTVQDRAWFERLKDAPDPEAASFTDDEQMIRQFLRGDPDGANKWTDSSGYAFDLLGGTP